MSERKIRVKADFCGHEFIDYGNDVPYNERYECQGKTGATIDEVVHKVLGKRDMMWVYDLAEQLRRSVVEPKPTGQLGALVEMSWEEIEEGMWNYSKPPVGGFGDVSNG